MMELAMSKMEHLHAQAQAMLAQHAGRASPSLSHSSPEPPTPPISRVPSMSAVHGAMLSHGHDILMGKLHKVSYSSPPPIACSPENNMCKLINYRNAKIAAFVVDGRELVCLPQAFELFLKHLVGGLHTVYTKLKRLDIIPIVCNVEQVRVLRGLGAIQPGVNRCKLISCKEFDILYEDCTNSSARPGRPPKRSPAMQHASPETIDKLKKARFDAPDYYNTRLFDAKNFLNGFPHHPYAMGPLPFMQLNHPLLSPPVNMAMAQQLGYRNEGMMSGSRDNPHADHDRIPSSSDERKERDSPSPKSVDLPYHPAFHKLHKEDDENTPLNLHINGHADDLRKSPIHRDRSDDDDDDDIDDDNPSDDDKSAADSGELLDTLTPSETGEITQADSPPLPSLSNGTLQGYASIETLLMNIQGLLKVAAENARHQDLQVSELKMELYQEKKAREDINTHLIEEQKQKTILRKRLRRARRDRKRLQSPTENSELRLHTPTKSDLSTVITATTPRPGNGVMSQDSPQMERFGNSVSLGDTDRNVTGTYSSVV